MHRPFVLAALSSLAVGLLAFSCTEGATSGDANLNERGEACSDCLRDLTECSATAKTDAQFVECRDIFATCQKGKQLGPDKCSNPQGREACSLCNVRLEQCRNGASDAAKCTAEHQSCLKYLHHGKACDAMPPAGTCESCNATAVKCVFDAGTSTLSPACIEARRQCLTNAQILDTACPAPQGDPGCAMCGALLDVCGSAPPVGDAGTPDPSRCDAGFNACVLTFTGGPLACPAPGATTSATTSTASATSSTATTSATGGGGPASSSTGDPTTTGGTGGAGGANGSTGSGNVAACAHSPCVIGGKLESGCSACVTTVCAQDSYCCGELDGEWDSNCVGRARTVSSCGCQP